MLQMLLLSPPVISVFSSILQKFAVFDSVSGSQNQLWLWFFPVRFLHLSVNAIFRLCLYCMILKMM